MRPRLAAALACLLVPAFLSVVGLPASADPAPTVVPYSGYWPACGVPPDDDGRYCVVSVTRNGVEVGPRSGSSEYEEPYIDLIGAGTVRFGVNHFPAGSFDADGDADPSATWRWQVNTGAIQTREMYGRAKNVELSLGGGSAGGYTFDLTLQPVPIAERFYDPGFTCDTSSCGDDTTTADLEYAGFVTGYVTDDEHDSVYSPAERERREGLVTAYSSQDASYSYDYDTNTIVVRMANPHLRSDGVTPVTGSFETFLPDEVLLVDLGVPDPASLTGGRVEVTRAGAPSVPFTLSHEPGGIRIRISGITFSTPRYRIKPRPSRPGVPRIHGAVRKPSRAVEVRFARPLADGGTAITSYLARCRKGQGPWHTASRVRGPVTVTGVPRGQATCQVRARNARGPGPWSSPRHT